MDAVHGCTGPFSKFEECRNIFMNPVDIASLSRFYADHPYFFGLNVKGPSMILIPYNCGVIYTFDKYINPRHAEPRFILFRKHCRSRSAGF